MARVVSVGILPDGTLSRTPASAAARFLRARYSKIQVAERELPLTAIKVFRRTDPSKISRSVRPLSVKICLDMDREVFEGDTVEFPGGVGIMGRINSRALESIARVCARRIRATPTRLPKILASPGASYTHVLSGPGAYTSCMKSMGWEIYPTFLHPMGNSRLRISPEGRAHRLASLRLDVAIDYAVPDGSVYCIDSRNMMFAMGRGTAAYDYAAEKLLIEQEFALDVTRANVGVEVVVPVRHPSPGG